MEQKELAKKLYETKLQLKTLYLEKVENEHQMKKWRKSHPDYVELMTQLQEYFSMMNFWANQYEFYKAAYTYGRFPKNIDDCQNMIQNQVKILQKERKQLLLKCRALEQKEEWKSLQTYHELLDVIPHIRDYEELKSIETELHLLQHEIRYNHELQDLRKWYSELHQFIALIDEEIASLTDEKKNQNLRTAGPSNFYYEMWKLYQEHQNSCLENYRKIEKDNNQFYAATQIEDFVMMLSKQNGIQHDIQTLNQKIASLEQNEHEDVWYLNGSISKGKHNTRILKCAICGAEIEYDVSDKKIIPVPYFAGINKRILKEKKGRLAVLGYVSEATDCPEAKQLKYIYPSDKTNR